MRANNTSAWLGTMVASGLVFALLLLIGGLRAERGAAAAAAPLPNDPSSSAALISLTSDITPTLAITIAEPVRLNQPTLVTATVSVTPTQAYQVNFDTGGTPTLSPVFTGTQTIPNTLTFVVSGTQVVTAELLRLPAGVYEAIIVTKTVTVIDPNRPTTLSLTAAPTLVAADGTSSATLTATVVNELGEPIRGTPVRFTSTLAPPTERQTNAAGVAVIGLTSPTSATAEITATAVNNPLAKDTISVVFASPAPQAIQITRQPSAPVVGDGQQPVDLSIRLLDQFGAPVPNTPVRFSTDLGTWGPAEPYSEVRLNQSSTINTAATTNRDGFARALLIAPINVSGSNRTATVQVEAGTATTTLQVIFTSLPSDALQLTANETSAAGCGSGTAQITATLTLTSGLPVASQPINFTSTGGSFVLTPTTTTTSTTTDSKGNATVPLFIRAGDFGPSPIITVTAQFGQQQQSVQVVQQCRIYLPTIASAPARITLNTPLPEPRLIAPGEAVTVMAKATNASGATLQNTDLRITTTLGVVQQERLTTDASGTVTATLIVSTTGTATVTAVLTGSIPIVEPLILTVVTPTLTLVPTSGQNQIETGQSTTLRARLFLAASETITRALEGRQITFIATGGGALTPPQEITSGTGEATTTYTAPANTGPVTITASSNGIEPVSRTLQVVRPLQISTVTLEPAQAEAIADRTAADGSTTPQNIPLVLTARDANGTPVSGRELQITTNLSSFANSAIQLTTDANGQVRTALRGIAQLADATLTVRDTRFGTEFTATPSLKFVAAACPDKEPDNNSVLTLPRPPALGWLNGICKGRIATSGPESVGEENSDYYMVELAAETQITVRLTEIPASTNYNIFLFPQELEQRPLTALIGSNRPGNQDEEFTFVVPRTERYYIRVFAATKAAPGAPDGYTLTVRTQQ